MPYNTKVLKTDQKLNPVSQYFNQITDDFEPVLGANGANRVLIYDASGNPLLTAANPGAMNLISSTLSAVTILQNAAVAIGAGLVLPTNGQGVASIAISGTFVATITFEGQAADGNWYAINARQRSGGTISSTTTSAGLYEINCMGLTSVRANITAYTSGSVTAKGQSQALTPTSDTFQLTGRNVQEFIGHNGIAITTTTNVNTALIDVSTLGGRKNIYVLNTLNQSVVINVFSYPISGAGGVQIGTKTIASGNATITPTDIPMLGEPLQKILLQAVCSVAPTAGVITTYVEGVQP